MMDYRYTRHQVARGTRPDAEDRETLYLIKNVSTLRATYQVRLLTYRALHEGRKLVLRVPKHFKTSRSLRMLMKECPKVIRVEKV